MTYGAVTNANDPTTLDSFYDHYDYLLKMIRHNMPETKIMLIEPFVLSPPCRTGPAWREDLDPKIQVVRDLARKYADYYIPMDGIYASLCANTYTPSDLAEDGVHPSQLGHAILAETYLRTLENPLIYFIQRNQSIKKG